jgi:preprotein translocase subunit SecA
MQAGRSGAVTIATNMAGRGTDIKLGGDPAGYVDEILRDRDIDPEFATDEDRQEALDEAKRLCDEDREKVVAAGGLYILGTEKHESRRIDNQLRGRSGRQGDPGESRFFVSLEDELMRRFGSDRVAGIMGRIGMDEDMPLESKMVTGMLEQAQTKVEAHNFDIRKNVVEYDDVIARQREVVYADRHAVLEHADMRDRIMEMMGHEVKRLVQQFTQANLPEDWDLDGLVKHFESLNVQIPDEVFPETLNRLKRDTLVSDITRLTQETYEKKEQSVIDFAKEHDAVESGEFYMRQFERAVVLHVIDMVWREHIDHLDVMRSGIGLRGVAQRDPLVEFKREAFAAFEELKAEIEHFITEYALKVGVNLELRQPPPQALPQNTKTNAADIAKTSGQAKDAGNLLAPRPKPNTQPANGKKNGAQPNGAKPNNVKGGGAKPQSGRPGQPQRVVPVAATSANRSSAPGKIGRNDPCFCGSGKKYKQCHGR